jgi:alpha-glucosidase
MPSLAPVWWRDAVIYQVYPRSFADSDGDGTGDLPGVTARLPYLAELGVDGVWLSPFYRSPLADAGYDVADYRDVDPRFGTLADVDALIARAGELGLVVLVDLVPNHSSDQHPWFQAAVAAGPGSPERARYLFRDGRGANGELPPNNWLSVFGGAGWTRITEADGRPGQWYLHLFDVHQPDFDWTSPDVRAEFESVLRFWLDRGVAGFRVDVAHGLIKAPGLPDLTTDPDDLATLPTNTSPFWDQDGVHEVYAAWRRLLDSYGAPERVLCAEAWVSPPERMACYVRVDEMHQSFAFDFLGCRWNATELREVIDAELGTMGAVGAPTTWVLSNHDVVRHASRLGTADPGPVLGGIQATDPQPDRALGLQRARAATLLMLALPGAAYLYQGEELGLPEHTTLPDAVRDDPVWIRSAHTHPGRDGCRVPLPWVADAPGFGFSPTGATWLPQPPVFAEYAADVQAGVAGSTLELYRSALRLRRAHGLGRAQLAWVADAAAGTVQFDSGAVRVMVNCGAAAQAIPADRVVACQSGPLTPDGLLPVDTTVWLVAR